MKKGFISLVAAAAISGIALADSSNTTELDLISIATQGAMSEQSAGIVVLSEAEAAEVIGGRPTIVVNGVSTGKSPPYTSILPGFTAPVNASCCTKRGY